jgi:hypothetical protein
MPAARRRCPTEDLRRGRLPTPTRPGGRRAPGASGELRQSDEERRALIARLLLLWPHEVENGSREARERLLARLRSALRAERGRGIAGHWTYDLARHVELLRAYRTELAALDSLPPRAHGPQQTPRPDSRQ